MAFWGSEFIFDDIPCCEYGLMVYSFNSASQQDVDFKSGNVIEDRISGRYDALTYGLVQNESLEYVLVFGANMESVDKGAYLDRYEVEAISTWLTGHQTRKWLTIMQDDMRAFRYKCTISDLKLITYADYPWAFSCRVSCDSPFAYTYPEEFNYSVNGESRIIFHNRSSYNGFYYPQMNIKIRSGSAFSVRNITDGGKVLKFDNLPQNENLHIQIDNKNKVITNNYDLNLYPYFNKKFLRLARGDNELEVEGDAEFSLVCEFPVSIGG